MAHSCINLVLLYLQLKDLLYKTIRMMAAVQLLYGLLPMFSHSPCCWEECPFKSVEVSVDVCQADFCMELVQSTWEKALFSYLQTGRFRRIWWRLPEISCFALQNGPTDWISSFVERDDWSCSAYDERYSSSVWDSSEGCAILTEHENSRRISVPVAGRFHWWQWRWRRAKCIVPHRCTAHTQGCVWSCVTVVPLSQAGNGIDQQPPFLYGYFLFLIGCFLLLWACGNSFAWPLLRFFQLEI